MNTAYEKRYDRLNVAQKMAVDAIDGPVMVIAGPGTGKTEVLGARIANILRKTDTKPEEILCMTYTTAGVKAMRERLVEFIGADAFSVQIFTFHSFGAEVIKRSPDRFSDKELSPASDLAVMQVLEGIVRSLPASHRLRPNNEDAMLNVMQKLRHLFGIMKQEYWTPEQIQAETTAYIADLPNNEAFQYKRKYKEFQKDDPNPKKIAEETEKMEDLMAGAALFNDYEQKLKQKGHYEFADMLRWVVDAWKADEAFLELSQERFQYILVDEYQDTNGIQSEMLQLLINYWDVPNLFVVGDDDQSIYRFQGANMRNLLHLAKKYEGIVKLVVLTENYRSSQEILNASQSVIENNNERLNVALPELEKTLKASNEAQKAKKSSLRVLKSQNAETEAQIVAAELAKIYKKTKDISETAVLVRNHKDAEALQGQLRAAGLPFVLQRQENAFDSSVFHMILDVLRYAEKEAALPLSGEGLLFKVLHAPWWGISALELGKMAMMARQKRREEEEKKENPLHGSLRGELSENEDEKVRGVFNFLEDLIGKVAYEPVLGVLQAIVRGNQHHPGLLRWAMRQTEPIKYLKVIQSMYDAIYASAKGNKRFLVQDFVVFASEMERYGLRIAVQEQNKAKNGVQIMTTHSSKGLEFESVYILGANKNNWEGKTAKRGQFRFPDTLTEANAGSEVEEVRRLFFVGMTRAKTHLTLSVHEQNQAEKALEPSRMVIEAQKSGEFAEKYDEKAENEAEMPQSWLIMDHKVKAEAYMRSEVYTTKLESYSLSPSGLNAFLRCPAGWFYEQFISVPHSVNPYMAHGQAVHYVAEMRDRIWQSKKVWIGEREVKKLYESKLSSYQSLLSEETYQFWLEKGLYEVPQFINSLQKEEKDQFLVEKLLKAELEGVKLKGRLDKISIDPQSGAWDVIDYKTGKFSAKKMKSPDEKEMYGGDFFRQMGFYAVLAELNGKKCAGGRFIFAEKDEKTKSYPQKEVRITEEHKRLIKALIAEVWQKIKQKDLRGGCGDCEWCEMQAFVDEKHGL